jgi:aspartyl-tRNA(Asn)/glutamyl-tRNA(Gln) amidotransferase subunit A
MGYADVEPEVLDICNNAVKTFIDCGADVEEAHPEIRNPIPHIAVIFRVDHLAMLSTFGPTEEIAKSVDPITVKILHAAAKTEAVDYAKAMFEKQLLAVEMGKFFRVYDLLLTPTLPASPPSITQDDYMELTKWLAFTAAFNLTGQPAATVPAGWTSEGMPVGLQIVGRPYQEDIVFRAAATFEEAAPWAHMRPRLD